MTTQLAPRPPADRLMQQATSKYERSRLTQFVSWLADTGRTIFTPDLAAYRDHSLASRQATTVVAHLSTIRNAYQRLLRNDALRDQLYAMAGAELQRLKHDDSPANRKAFVDEQLTRLNNALNPAAAPVTVIKHQDEADSAHIRLTREQAEALLAAPGVETVDALRDTAVLAMLLCTGLREMELCSLEVDDLRQRLGSELAVLVRAGKGAKQRLVPYGELEWCLVIVDKWLKAAGITEGKVFRSFRHGRSRVREQLSVRAVEGIVTRYSISIDGHPTSVRPHDLRRTYARQMYEAGVDLLSLSQNLGHTDTHTTLGYIGALDASQRRAPRLYTFDLNRLKRFRPSAINGLM